MNTNIINGPRQTLSGWIGVCLLCCVLTFQVRAAEGVALGIVFDTSGSMADSVRDSGGKMTPKQVIASRALLLMVDRLEHFATNAAPEARSAIQAGLYVFEGGKPKNALALDAFKPAAFRQWAATPRAPGHGTPLGETLRLAGDEVIKSSLARKHLLVITDGMNTVGPDPAVVLPALFKKAEKGGSDLSVHFVAFDIAAKVFAPVKKLGATVVEAADEKELRSQLEFILEDKILLEKDDRK